MQKDSLLILCTLLALSAVCLCDSGVVRISQVDGPWRITVFSEPTPFRAGAVDISVLVQEESDDSPVLDATVSLMLEHAEGLADSMLVEATREAATNQLLYSGKFDLPASGMWNIEAAALRGDQLSRVRFEAEAAEALPPFLELWFWFLLPGIAIILIVMNQWLQRRDKRSPATEST
ncbi:MAG: hypothetical protein P8M22_10680 [Phycisphaerales bacterium]|nr:hypothetical protein [Phycisphaerales bacterium]